MPVILLLLGYAFNVVCMIHVLRSGRSSNWLFILAATPVVGPIFYFITEWLPEIQMSRGGQRFAGNVDRVLNPDRELRERVESLDIADTADNKRALGEELIRRGMFADAVRCYEAALAPPHDGDPALLIGLARAHFAGGDHGATLAALDRLQQAHPGYESRDAHMIYARSLEALGREDEAEAEYRTLVGYAGGPEARVRYALLLQKRGRPDAARALFDEVVRTYGPRYKSLEREDRDWLAVAQRNSA